MMNTLLVALNAKYIHSNIAVRYLQKYAAPSLSRPPKILELTINNRLDFILDEIFRRSPDILLFSTYIWNVDMVRHLAAEYRKLRPDALIGAKVELFTRIGSEEEREICSWLHRRRRPGGQLRVRSISAAEPGL